MIKKTIFLVLALCLSLALVVPGLIRAQNELSILDSSAQVEFPFTLRFNLSAESDVDITDIRLRYRVERMSFAPVTSEIYVEFAPASVVSISASLELVKIGGLPPGSSVEYWWAVADAR